MVFVMYFQVVTIDGAEVTLVDQNATNGVIHVIDKVMYPLPTGRIPLTVASTPSLSTLLYAVTQARLAEALNGSYVFTYMYIHIYYSKTFNFFLLLNTNVLVTHTL